jgi:predicted nucleic acid-binding Zn ribbon protein
MFTKILITAGIIGMAVALLYFMATTKTDENRQEVVNQTKMIFFGSAALIPSAYVLRFLGSILGLGSGRCRKCGKRIERQEMYCFNHRLESIRQAQDRSTRFSDQKPKPRR